MYHTIDTSRGFRANELLLLLLSCSVAWKLVCVWEVLILDVALTRLRVANLARSGVHAVALRGSLVLVAIVIAKGCRYAEFRLEARRDRHRLACASCSSSSSSEHLWLVSACGSTGLSQALHTGHDVWASDSTS